MLVILEGLVLSTSRENELREKNWNVNLQKAYEKGNKLFIKE